MIEIFFDQLRANCRFFQLPFSNTRCQFSTNRPYFSLQISNTCLPRIFTDDLPQRVISEFHFGFAQTVFAYLPRDEVSFRDRDLLTLSVAREKDNLHSITQRTGDCLKS